MLGLFNKKVLKNIANKITNKFVNITYKKDGVEKPQITFIGGTGTVTGSKYLLEYKDKRILVDCGLFQGDKEDIAKNKRHLPVPSRKIDAIILTHAHLDHSGYIPFIVKDGFKGPVYATNASYELCKLILPDSGFLQEEDIRYLVKKRGIKHGIPLPLYTQEDAVKSLKNFKIVRFNDRVKIDENISFEIVSAGHILGAGIVMVDIGGVKIVFSGDLGRTDDEILHNPTTVTTADYILCESTYGDRVHKDIDTKAELAKIINRTVSRGGNLIVPAFAVGRAQLLLYMVYQLKKERAIPQVPVFVDSPMAIKITHLLDDFSSEHKLSEKECLGMFKDTKFTSTVDQSKRIFEQKVPSIIISASGMATGGRVLHHIAHYGPDNLNTILLVGFQAAGTRGRLLQEGKKELKIYGQTIRINAEVAKLENMSAHADSEELIEWLSAFTQEPNTLFIVHGELKASNSFAEKVKKELKWNVVVPEYLQVQRL
ncbi:MAG: MBL fold metallo-hydrolase [Rickettsiales bacterium]|jgi:metallo-beta-lactamase family protein|nr:MBL fold metallo-hydrolase [Rickettsiales bacterium]